MNASQTGFDTMSCMRRADLQSASKMEPAQLGLELAIVAITIILAVFFLYIYVKLSPKENIPREYFFKVREPKIRLKREAEAKTKNALKSQVEL
jgi:hypothetical protein